MLYALLMAGGKGAARNPNLSVGGQQEHSDVSKLDPIGNWITGWGGDPLNIYGNKNNPNALLFPGTTGSPGLGAAGAYSPMQSGMNQQQMSMLAKLGGSGNLGGAFNNYLSAIGQPSMPIGSPSNQQGGQLQQLMQSARQQTMPYRPMGAQPMMNQR